MDPIKKDNTFISKEEVFQNNDTVKSQKSNPINSPKNNTAKSLKNDSLKSKKKDALKSPKNASSKPQKKIALKSPKNDTSSSQSNDSLKSPKIDAVKSPKKAALKCPKNETSKSQSTDSLKSPKIDALKFQEKIALKSPKKDALKFPSNEALKSQKNDAHKSQKNETVESRKSDTNNSVGFFVDDTMIDGIVKSCAKYRQHKSWFPDREDGYGNVLSAEQWLLEETKSTFQGAQNICTLRSTEAKFADEVTQAYQKLYDFILDLKTKPIDVFDATTGSQPVFHSDEINSICFPLFVNILIQLFECGSIKKAVVFFNKHVKKFLNKKPQIQILAVFRESLIKKSLIPGIQSIKNSRFCILITEASMEILTEFLIKENHLSLLQIMNTNLQFRPIEQHSYQNKKIKNDSVKSEVKDGTTFNIEIKENFSSEGAQVVHELQKVVADVNCELEKTGDFEKSVNICQYHIRSQRVTSVDMNKELNKVAVGTENSAIVLWDFELTDELMYYSARAAKHWQRIPVKRVISEVDFSGLDYKDAVDRANSQKNRIVHRQDQNLTAKVKPMVLRGHSSAVYDLSFVHETDLLLSASGDKTIRLWDTNSPTCLGIFQGHIRPIWTLDSNEQGLFISGSMDGSAYLWDLERTIPLRNFYGHGLGVNQVRFHPNGNYLATASNDKMIVLWDVNQARQVRKFDGHLSAVNTILFSECGGYLFSGSDEGMINIWDISQGKLLNTLYRHRDLIRSLASSSGDRRLASIGSLKSEVHIWDKPLTTEEPTISVGGEVVHLEESITTDLVSQSQALGHPALIGLRFLKDNFLLTFTKIRN